ncbi:MAG TPA: hypothetical protein VIQ02_12990, partial [Jiangellaceae bacterium]
MGRLFRLLLPALGLAVLVVGVVLGPANARSNAPHKASASTFQTAKPLQIPSLREMRPVAAARHVQVRRGLDAPQLAPTSPFGSVFDAPTANAPVSAARGDIPDPIVNFEGISVLCGCYPPDTNGDIGPNHYMEWVNLHYAIYDRAGNVLVGPSPGNTIFTGHPVCGTTNNGDPIVLYDSYAGRWLASQFAFQNVSTGPYYQCIAISNSSDPTAGWCTYEFQVHTTKFNDYPKFGVWPSQNAYMLTAPQFLGGATFAGVGVWGFERDVMLSCGTARMVYQDLPSQSTRMLPGDADGPNAPPTGAPNPIASMKDGAVNGGVDRIEIFNATINWATPSISVVPEGDLPTTAFDSVLNCTPTARSCIPQPGTTVRIDALSNRLMHRLQYRNFGAHQSMVVTHTVDTDGTGMAGIRWYEFRKTSGNWTIFDQGVYAPGDGVYRFMGSAAMDRDGNIAAGYSVSNGSSVFPGIRYAGRLASDPPGTFGQGEATLINGTGSQTGTASR